MLLKDFQDYCWSFYGPKNLDGHIFGHKLTREELDAACLIQSKQETYEGDSFDREKARDILLVAQGKETEFFGGKKLENKKKIPLAELFAFFQEFTDRQCELRDRQDILDTQERQELDDLEIVIRGLKRYATRRNRAERG